MIILSTLYLGRGWGGSRAEGEESYFNFLSESISTTYAEKRGSLFKAGRLKLLKERASLNEKTEKNRAREHPWALFVLTH